MLISILLLHAMLGATAQTVEIKGVIVDQKNQPIPYATIAFQSKATPTVQKGGMADVDGRFSIALPADRYLISVQALGFQNLIWEQEIQADLNLGSLQLREQITALDQVTVQVERSHLENELGKTTVHIGSDLSNAGGNAVDALEMLPSVTTTINGLVNVRGSENVIIYVNGKETKRDPKSLQFISADVLEKIELITSPSAKYDAEGVAGIINLVYKKTRSTQLDVFGSLAVPFRSSAGTSTGISGRVFSAGLTVNESRSRFRDRDDQLRTTPERNLRKYENLTSSHGNGLTREVNATLSFEPDTSLAMGLEVNYLKWRDGADQVQTGIFQYANDDTISVKLFNDWLEIEHEGSITLFAEKNFGDQGMLSLQAMMGGEDEVNQANFNRKNATISNTPIEQSIRSTDETESQRYYQFKVETDLPLNKNLVLKTGFVADASRINMDQALDFFESEPVSNRFQIDTDKYAGFALMANEGSPFEYELGLRYEWFFSTSLEKASDSVFNQRFTNFFPSLQGSYTFANKAHRIGFSFTRRINRPSFWEISPFLSYVDPLNLETGNPYLVPELASLYELSLASTLDHIGINLKAFRRSTEQVIQQVTRPLDEDRLLVTYDNFGVRYDDGFEWSLSADILEFLTIDASGSAYHTHFQQNVLEVFFNRRWNWQMRFKERIQLSGGWRIDLTQYYRAPRFGAQSVSLAQTYLNLGVQKSFLEKRGSVALSLTDVFNSRVFGREVRTNETELVNTFKFQTRLLKLSMRYKIFKRDGN